MKRTDTVRDQIESWLQESSNVNLYDTLKDRSVFAIDSFSPGDLYLELRCEFEEFAHIELMGDTVIMVLH